MTRIALWILMLGLALACGGEPQEFADEYTESLGTEEQELITQVSSKSESECVSTTGAMYESSPFAGLTYTAVTCASGYTVYVPQTKTVSIKTSNSSGYCTTTQYNDMIATLDTVIAELNTSASIGGSGGWTFSRSTSGTHTMKCEAIPTSSFGNQHIRSYSRVKPDFGGATITYGDSVYDGASVAGWTFLTMQIDVPDIYGKGSSATADARILWHAVSAAVNKATGTGEYAGVRMASSDDQVSEASGRVMFSTGERCRARNFSTTDPNAIFWSTSASCSNN